MKRTFYDENDSVTFSESGFWFYEWEKNVLRTLETFIPSEEISRATEDENCLAEPFCGFANFFSIEGFYWKSQATHFIVPAKLEKLESFRNESSNSVTFNFALHMTSLVNIYLVTKSGWTYESPDLNLSFLKNYEGRNMFFTKINYGKKNSDDGPFIFNLIMRVS